MDAPRPVDRRTAWERAVLALEGRFLRGYSRLVLGTKAADGLGLPRGPWTLAPLVLAPLHFVPQAHRSG